MIKIPACADCAFAHRVPAGRDAGEPGEPPGEGYIICAITGELLPELQEPRQGQCSLYAPPPPEPPPGLTIEGGM